MQWILCTSQKGMKTKPKLKESCSNDSMLWRPRQSWMEVPVEKQQFGLFGWFAERVPREFGRKPHRILRLDRLDPFLKEGIQKELGGSLAEFRVWIVWIPSLLKIKILKLIFNEEGIQTIQTRNSARLPPNSSWIPSFRKGSKRSKRIILRGFLPNSPGTLFCKPSKQPKLLFFHRDFNPTLSGSPKHRMV